MLIAFLFVVGVPAAFSIHAALGISFVSLVTVVDGVSAIAGIPAVFYYLSLLTHGFGIVKVT